MERMEDIVPDANEQSLQHFISNSTWDARAVMDEVAVEADALLGGYDDTILVIDDSGIPKKGEHSVGVSRQYCGQTGKVDNCQVGVYASLVRGDKATLIDARLFLPERWTNDVERCEKAGVPEEERQFRTKHEIALEIIQNAVENGVRFAYVAFDGFYGENGELLRILDGAGVRFFADVHKDQRMFAKDPLSTRNATPVRVDEWVAAQPHQAWRRVTVRQGTKGPLEVELLHRRVWLFKNTDKTAHYWHLIVRREIGSKDEIKYTLSNAAPDLPRQQLAYLQGQRYWVERCLQEAKQQAGLGDYQVRGWIGWHHHMAMVLLATLFMLEQRIESGEEELPLTCSDIEWLLRQMLPARGHTEGDILLLLERRLKRRGVDVDLHSPPR